MKVLPVLVFALAVGSISADILRGNLSLNVSKVKELMSKISPLIAKFPEATQKLLQGIVTAFIALITAAIATPKKIPCHFQKFVEDFIRVIGEEFTSEQLKAAVGILKLSIDFILDNVANVLSEDVKNGLKVASGEIQKLIDTPVLTYTQVIKALRGASKSIADAANCTEKS